MHLTWSEILGCEYFHSTSFSTHNSDVGTPELHSDERTKTNRTSLDKINYIEKAEQKYTLGNRYQYRLLSRCIFCGNGVSGIFRSLNMGLEE
jgi:hypothetical protein